MGTTYEEREGSNLVNYNTYIVADLETSSADPHTTQPIEIAAVVVDSRRLTIGESFCSMLYVPEECLEPQALAVNKKTIAEVLAAPPQAQVWRDFISFVYKYNYKGTPWTAPILVGYNIKGFDSIIFSRLAREYGPWDDKRNCQKLFNQFMQVDLLDDVWRLNEYSTNLENLKFDTLRTHFGLSKEGAHSALVDVLQTAEVFRRFMQFYRKLAPKWFETSKGCLSEVA